MLKSLIILALLFSSQAFSSQDRVRLCQESCVDFEEPGYALKKCLSQCLKLIEDTKSYCNSYEDDCDRDSSGDDSSWYND